MALTSILNVLQGGQQSRFADRTPVQLVLEVLGRNKSIPMTDVVKATSLKPEDCLDAIEKLRAQGLAEVVEMKGAEPGFLLLRITPAGYAAVSTAPPA